jgi:hypothetical protein
MEEDEATNRQAGVFLTAVGGLWFLSAAFVGFKRWILISSNALFFTGIGLIIGTEKLERLFLAPKHLRASVCLVLGFLLILFNRGMLGWTIQILGAFLLFGGFLPVILKKFRRIPGIGDHVRVTLPKFVYDMNPEESLPR